MDKRANQLHEEYLDKARTADLVHGGVQEGLVGRLEAKPVKPPTSLYTCWLQAEPE